MNINQIVKGHKAGTFIIIGFRRINGIESAQVKCVNPLNHKQVARGEFALPLDALTLI